MLIKLICPVEGQYRPLVSLKLCVCTKGLTFFRGLCSQEELIVPSMERPPEAKESGNIRFDQIDRPALARVITRRPWPFRIVRIFDSAGIPVVPIPRKIDVAIGAALNF